jgi:diphthamide biosynthesis protein 7
MAEEEGKLVHSLSSRVLDLPPSCVEFCPASPSYFLVGTYSLQPDGAGESHADVATDEDSDDEGGGQRTKPKQPQSRNGSIIAFRLEDDIV